MSCWQAQPKWATPTNDMNKLPNNSEVRAEQAASTKLQTLKLGLDIHAESIVVVRILDHSAPQPAQKFTPAKFRAWVQTQNLAGVNRSEEHTSELQSRSDLVCRLLLE